MSEHVPSGRAERVALFRFKVISEAVNPRLTPSERGFIVRGLAAQVHLDGEGVERRVSRGTIDRWITAYRAGGLDGLGLRPRVDAGRSRQAHARWLTEAARLRREVPGRSAAQIVDIIGLDRLWVFAGGFELAAAHAVSTAGGGVDELDTLDLLDTLVDQSLVQARELEGRTRYSMLETLRQYAAERSSEVGRNDLRARHAAYYLAYARAADERLRGPEQADWFRRLETEHDNLRAALAWSLGPDGDPATGLRIAAALWWFWRVRSHLEEGSRWNQLALGGAPTPETALDRVRALLGAGLLGYFQRTHESAVEVLERARNEALRLGDDEGAGWALQGLGRILLDRRDRRDHEASMALLGQSIECFRRCGDERGIGYSTFFLGSVTSFAGRPGPEVERHFDEAERTLRTLGDIWGLIGVAVVRAWHAARNRDAPAAAFHYGQQLEGSITIDSPWMAALALFGVARSAAMAGRLGLAVELFGSGRVICAAMGAQADKLAGPSETRSLQEARQAVGDQAVDVAWGVGRARTVEEALAAGLAAAAALAAPVQAAAPPVPNPPVGGW